MQLVYMGSTPIFLNRMVDKFYLKDGEKYAYPRLYDVYIYTLNDIQGVRYIGQTNNPSIRICHHRIAARNGKDKSKKGEWINSGNMRCMEVIERCRNDESNMRERYWIKFYRDSGCDLLNRQLKK